MRIYFTTTNHTLGIWLHTEARQIFRLFVSASHHDRSPSINFHCAAMSGGNGVSLPLPSVAWRYQGSILRKIGWRISEGVWGAFRSVAKRVQRWEHAKIHAKREAARICR